MRIAGLLSFVPLGWAYNRPECSAWPGRDQWNVLRESLDGELNGPFTDPAKDYAANCIYTDQSYVNLLKQGAGLCFGIHACANEFCETWAKSNLPAYSIEAKSISDIQKGLAFARTHDIAVSVKSSGHSYQSQSSQADSLLIWMRHFPINNAIKNFTDSCGNSDMTVSVAGGTNFDEVFNTIKSNHHIVTGFCQTVALGGGWTLGGGLSWTARRYGYGVDQVRSFQVVLANGTLVEADACQNEDLFWALRGGGGGFGVITNVEYKLHDPTKITALNFEFDGGGFFGFFGASADDFTRSWMQFVVRNAPDLDDRWAGIVGPTDATLLFSGPIDDARESNFIKLLDDWYENELDNPGFSKPSTLLVEHSSFYDFNGGQKAYENPEFDGKASSLPSFFRGTFSRVIPEQVFRDKPKELAALLASLMISGDITTKANYLLGGATNKVPANATAIHPNMRRAVLEVEAYRSDGANRLRTFLQGYDTSVCYNHHSAEEPDWQNELWGSQYPELLRIKRLYDPDHVFNVYHGVDHRGAVFGNDDDSEILSPNCPRTDSLNILFLVPTIYASIRQLTDDIPIVGTIFGFFFEIIDFLL